MSVLPDPTQFQFRVNDVAPTLVKKLEAIRTYLVETRDTIPRFITLQSVFSSDLQLSSPLPPASVKKLTTGIIATVTGIGDVLQYGGADQIIGPVDWFAIGDGKSFDARMKIRSLDDPGPRVSMGFLLYDAQGIYLGATGTTVKANPLAVADGWQVYTLSTTSASLVAANSRAAYMRGYFERSGEVAARTQLAFLDVSDVLTGTALTDAVTAAEAAAAAATAAAAAAAGDATTAAGHASSASSSASTASGAATSAAAQAVTAASQAANAASSASAAATSASGASTSASNAATSATSATSSANTATTQAGNAASSATAASSSAAAASTSASQASTSATLSAVFQGSFLNKNARFADWSGGSGTAPADWANGSNIAVNTRAAGDLGGYAFDQDATNAGQQYYAANAPAGMVGLMSTGYFVIEAEITLLTGAFGGSGVVLSKTGFSATLNFATDPDSTGSVLGAGTTGRRYKFSKLVNATGSATDWALWMATKLDAISSSQLARIKWHYCGVRAATQSEIDANTALASGVTNAAAIATETSARAAADSAISATVTTLSSTVSGHTSTLSTQAGAITTLQGENVAYWAVNGSVSPPGGASFFIEAKARSSYGGTPNSSVAFGAREILLFNTSGSTWLPAMRVSGGNVQIFGNLQAGSITTPMLTAGVVVTDKITANSVSTSAFMQVSSGGSLTSYTVGVWTDLSITTFGGSGTGGGSGGGRGGGAIP